MDDLITARYHITLGDFVKLCAAHQRYIWRRSPIILAGRVFLGLLVLALLTGWIVRHGNHAFDPGLLVELWWLPVLILLLTYLFHPKNFLNSIHYAQKFRTIAEASRSIEWGFGPDLLWMRTGLAESTCRWELFDTLVETPECFLFYLPGRHLVLWLPSRGFSSPGMLRSFTDLARTRVPNYVVLGECRFPAKPEPVGLDEL